MIREGFKSLSDPPRFEDGRTRKRALQQSRERVAFRFAFRFAVRRVVSHALLVDARDADERAERGLKFAA